MALTRREALIRGKCLFQCEYPKVRRPLEHGAYLLSRTSYRKYSSQWSEYCNIVGQALLLIEKTSGNGHFLESMDYNTNRNNM